MPDADLAWDISVSALLYIHAVSSRGPSLVEDVLAIALQASTVALLRFQKFVVQNARPCKIKRPNLLGKLVAGTFLV